MTSSNRLLNRVLLFVVGLGFLAVALLVLVPVLTGTQPSDILGLPRMLGLALPELTRVLVLTVAIVLAVLILVLTVAWVATRGRGRTRFAVDTSDVKIDAGALAEIVREALAGVPDVVGVRISAYSVRRRRVLAVALETRRHPDLPALMGEVRQAIARLDAALGTPLPVLVHLTTGVRTALTRERVTH
jgi:hypothetical protein